MRPVDLHWTLAEVAAATGGTVVGDPDLVITSVGTDSRDVASGSLFVAVRGEHFDGNRYAVEAVAKGAAAALVEPGTVVTPRVEVVDAADALRDLAAHRRLGIDVPVIAVTGSSGKTSTKDLLSVALPACWASPRSFNNEVGVPLTVLATPSDAEHVALEVGSRGLGHISWLMPAIRPDVAIITNLGVVHLETFGTTDRLADAKFELVEGLCEDGTAVLPFAEVRLRRSHRGRTVTFGTEPDADVCASGIVLDDHGRPGFDLITPAGSRRVDLPLSGAHQAVNAAAVTAAGLAAGVDLDRIVDGLHVAIASPWRMEIHRGSFTVVNDAYNANPDSVEAALHTVAAMPGRRIAVLGRMNELGPVAMAEHERIGRLAAELGYAAVVVVGNEPGIVTGAGRIARRVADVEHAHQILTGLLRTGDVVLVKASRTIGLEVLADRLAKDSVA